MAKDNTVSIIAGISIIFLAVLVVACLTIFSPAQEKKTLSVSNPVYDPENDLSISPPKKVDPSICYSTASCIAKLKEEHTTYDEFKKRGLLLNCDQSPCYVQGINYHAQP